MREQLTVSHLAVIPNLLHLLCVDPVDERLALVHAVLLAPPEHGLVHDDLGQHRHVDMVPREQLLLVVELVLGSGGELAEC
jgi:hypothetical protein